MSFEAPLWLLALLPLAAFAWWSRRAVAIPWALRALAGVALVVALAQPQTREAAPREVVLLLDRSESAAGASGAAREREWVEAAAARRLCASPCRVIAFGGAPEFAGIPADDALPPADPLAPEATDLAAALRLATGALPDGGRALLLSDGFDTTASDGLGTATAEAAEQGIRVDAVPLAGAAPLAPGDGSPLPATAPAPAATAPDAAVTRLDLPSPLRAGDPLTLLATVRSTVAGAAELTLTRDGGEIGRERIDLARGDNPLLLTYRAPAAGWHGYRLAIDLPGDAEPTNDALDATTRVAPAPRVLVVAAAPRAAGRLPATLAADGVETTTIPPADLTTQDLQDAEVVVLADLPATALSSAQTAALTTAVRDDGLGLLVLGGARSLSLGGWAGTPLDALSPVQSLRPSGVRRRQLALGLVLDRSSSMNDLAGGIDPKIAMARAAARSALRLTARDEDELAVVAFDATARAVVPLQRTTAANADAIGSLIDDLDADGGTNLLRGLEQGVAELENSEMPVRHMILLSDGVSEEGDYAPLLERMRAARISLSTVALGRDADLALMRRLAREGGGRFHAVPDARDLPRVFARETRRAAPSVAVRAPLPVAATAASPLIASLDGRTPPPLAGTVLTRLRPNALAPLTTTVNGRTTPVLAQSQQGLGRVVAWTPGVGSNAGDWLTAAPEVFDAAVRWAQRPVATPPLQPRLGPGGTVVVDPLATGGDTLDLATVAGTVRAPDGTVSELRFEQTAPSRYTAPLPRGAGTQPADGGRDGAGGTRPAADGRGAGDAPPPGLYAVAVTADGTAEADALLALPYRAELRPLPADAGQLGPIVAATGGRILDPADAAAGLAPDPGQALWRWPLGAAIVLLLAAVAADRRARRDDRSFTVV